MRLLQRLAASVVMGALVRRAWRGRPPRGSDGTAPAPAVGARAVRVIAAFLAVIAAGTLLVVSSGVMPVRASDRHWAITNWFLNFAMRRSVVFHALWIEAPPLDDPRLALKGATHYQLGCAPCHGSPMRAQPLIPYHMTPHPPLLKPAVPEWSAEQLFYIVKHGVKFTAMPAWVAAQRDDEVWAVVAFLRRLPQMTEHEYRELVTLPPAAADTTPRMEDLLLTSDDRPAETEMCEPCHGPGGAGRGQGAFPTLAGQRPDYLHATLQAYARGQRHSGIMQPIAAGLTDERIGALARYYGSRGRPAPAADRGAAAAERGAAIAARGVPDRDVPACGDCHGPAGPPRHPGYPLLHGQDRDYLALQLRLFREDRRGGTAFGHIMRRVARGLTDDQIGDVAAYYASAGP